MRKARLIIKNEQTGYKIGAKGKRIYNEEIEKIQIEVKSA